MSPSPYQHTLLSTSPWPVLREAAHPCGTRLCPPAADFSGRPLPQGFPACGNPVCRTRACLGIFIAPSLPECRPKPWQKQRATQCQLPTRSLTIPHLDSHITVTSHRLSQGKCMITDVAVSVACVTHLQDSAHDDNYCTDMKTARQCTQWHVRWRWRLAWVIVAASVPAIPRLRGVHW